MLPAMDGTDVNANDTREPGTISLIGMPGAGKSTVGVVLAKLCGLRFIDSDIDIQLREGATLQEILEAHGYRYLRSVEEEVLLALPLAQTVIATGGSVVYSPRIMARLRAAGPVVYLRADLETLERRVAAAPLRGIASAAGQSFADIHAERCPLYAQYADLTIDVATASADAIAAQILRQLARRA